MLVPGSNLLNMALTLIASQPVEWSAFLGITTDDAGIRVPTWAAPVTVRGSFQPVPHTLIQQLGLSFEKNYANFYASTEFTDVVRDKTGDRLTYAGKVYQIMSNNDWFAQDGWKGTLCVEVTNA